MCDPEFVATTGVSQALSWTPTKTIERNGTYSGCCTVINGNGKKITAALNLLSIIQPSLCWFTRTDAGSVCRCGFHTLARERREQYLTYLLVSIVLVFLLCHSLKFFLLIHAATVNRPLLLLLTLPLFSHKFCLCPNPNPPGRRPQPPLAAHPQPSLPPPAGH